MLEYSLNKNLLLAGGWLVEGGFTLTVKLFYADDREQNFG